MSGTNQIKDALLATELHKLPTSIDKVRFWYDRLNLNYLNLYDSDSFGDRELGPFKFSVPKEEKQDFAQWILSNFNALTNNSYFRLLDLGKMEAALELEIRKSEDKRVVILGELKKIDLFFEYEKSEALRPKSIKDIMGKAFTRVKVEQLLGDFNTYFDFLDYGLEPDWVKVSSEPKAIVWAANGVTYARYHKYLSERLTTIEKKEETTLLDLSLDQRLLLLHYLGALDKIRKGESAVKQALFLSLLLPNKKDRIRQRLSSINDLFTPKEKAKREKLKKDLEEIAGLLENTGMKTEAKKVKDELRKLSQ